MTEIQSILEVALDLYDSFFSRRRCSVPGVSKRPRSTSTFTVCAEATTPSCYVDRRFSVRGVPKRPRLELRRPRLRVPERPCLQAMSDVVSSVRGECRSDLVQNYDVHVYVCRSDHAFKVRQTSSPRFVESAEATSSRTTMSTSTCAGATTPSRYVGRRLLGSWRVSKRPRLELRRPRLRVPERPRLQATSDVVSSVCGECRGDLVQNYDVHVYVCQSDHAFKVHRTSSPQFVESAEATSSRTTTSTSFVLFPRCRDQLSVHGITNHHAIMQLAEFRLFDLS
ncbi:hypothetical protein Taro_000370 [Colocasia esculenta]|uniref:Uncharacterized protein n=1 Tax=Colocasia esculenta TaxID=4460 RepID=A0A843TBW2_COLES|nr:hypothetical protein [Colocasia esculenta]